MPEQKTPHAAVEWQALRLTGADALAVRASKKLKNDELLLGKLGCTILRKHLDEIPLWRGDHVMVRQLVEDFARYLYLPRLARPEVLVQALREGVALLTWQAETFAYAEGYDEASGRYRGLRAGQAVSLTAEDPGLIVKPEVARRQLELPPLESIGGGATPAGTSRADTKDSKDGREPEPGSPPSPRRYYGTVRLNPLRVGAEAGRIAEEVIAHLAGQPGAEVVVTLEIQVHLPHGASEQTVRTVTENSRTLKFENYGFETD
ncbi:hypothetical protein [Allomeiothermus silvanus]|uniref:hypothetical protein n=1 Tax=Allomeiothermus silvanus TaxID=52022 RepID=UPI00019E911F|nr:hypothetical protein [Allomeiothermus silvanus]